MGNKIEKIDLNKLQEREKSLAVFLTGGNSGHNIQTSSRLQAIHNLLLPFATAINQIADRLNDLEAISSENENVSQSSVSNADGTELLPEKKYWSFTPLKSEEWVDKLNKALEETEEYIDKPCASNVTTFATQYLENIKSEQEVFPDDLDKQQTKPLEEKSETETKTVTRRRPRK